MREVCICEQQHKYASYFVLFTIGGKETERREEMYSTKKVSNGNEESEHTKGCSKTTTKQQEKLWLSRRQR
jgi:hypothetical protein